MFPIGEYFLFTRAVGCGLSPAVFPPSGSSHSLSTTETLQPARTSPGRVVPAGLGTVEPPGRIIKIEKLNRKHLTSHLSYISPPLPSPPSS